MSILYREKHHRKKTNKVWDLIDKGIIEILGRRKRKSDGKASEKSSDCLLIFDICIFDQSFICSTIQNPSLKLSPYKSTFHVVSLTFHLSTLLVRESMSSPWWIDHIRICIFIQNFDKDILQHSVFFSCRKQTKLFELVITLQKFYKSP